MESDTVLKIKPIPKKWASNALRDLKIAGVASLQIHLFRDQTQRNRKRVPHLMRVGNLRF
jgi:hypothetical protein